MAPKDSLFDPDRNPLIRSDYRPSEYKIDKVNLKIDLDEDNTTVRSHLYVKRNPALPDVGGPLVLNGQHMKLLSVKIKENGKFRALDRQEFLVDDHQLILKRPPEGNFELQIETGISPKKNTLLEGIYSSGDIIASQCESQGFRNITYFLDRPDNLARYTVTLEADKAKYPVLLSNGNSDYKQTKDLANGRHKITWQDPWPKPSYLFATVAGNLKAVSGDFTTMSGKNVKINIFVEPGYENQVDWAMDSVKRVMKWDEEKYGREYDLDVFNIVAVDKFNAGAMENKGLNIFNIARLVGSPETSTDKELIDIEEVIAHEYAHNWTGDRITVRDWFEISLKESFTDYRSLQFSKDMHSRGIITINNANDIRTTQFPEDAGPSAHWVRPERSESIDNMYSRTIYGKGSHVIGMMNTILGDAEWRKAMDHYFDKFDGQAITVDDFIDNLQEVSGVDLKQFRTWYNQTGTPEISYEGKYDAQSKTYSLTLKQHVPATWDQPAKEKKNLHIPIAVGLIGQSGKDIPLVLDGDTNGDAAQTTRVLNLKDGEQTFVFKNVDGPVVPSVLRGFSAPVKLVTQPSHDELVFRMAHDSDPFNRYEASSTLMLKALTGLIQDIQKGKPLALKPDFLEAYAANLASATEGDKDLSALMLALPPYGLINQAQKTVDPDATWAAVNFMKKVLAEKFEAEFRHIYEETKRPEGQAYDIAPEQAGTRSLHNVSLGMLKTLATPEIVADAQEQYQSANNMTEKLAALSALVSMQGPETQALTDFYETYKDNTNVIDKWLSLQGADQSDNAVEHIRDVMKHKAFDITNPNKVRSLIRGGFTAGDSPVFHNADGSGYKLLADVVISLISINPRVAAQIVLPLTTFKRFDSARQEKMVAQLQRIMNTLELDADTKALVGNALATIAPAKVAKAATLKAAA